MEKRSIRNRKNILSLLIIGATAITLCGIANAMVQDSAKDQEDFARCKATGGTLITYPAVIGLFSNYPEMVNIQACQTPTPTIKMAPK